MKFLKTFLLIWIIGAICSLFPWTTMGLMLGFPAYTLNAFILTIIKHWKE